MAVKVTSKPKQEEKPVEFTDFEVEEELGFKPIDPSPETPDFPLKNIESNKDYLFWEWIDKLTNDDWDHIIMYLFREWPYIDRQRVNPDAVKNIDKFSLRWNKNDKKFLQDHGSGKYKVIVNDNRKATTKGKGGTIGIARFEVNDPDYPPVFVVEELVPEHPSNKQITAKLQAEGRLNIEGKVMNPQQTASNDNAALIGLLRDLIGRQSQQAPKDQSMDNVTSMFTKTHETAMNMLKDQVKSDDPEKLVKMLSALKEMMPKPEQGNNTLELIVKMQADMAKVQAEAQSAREGLMIKMMEMLKDKPDSSDAEDKILARIATYKELFGGDSGKGGKGNIWETAIEHGAPVAVKILETIQGVLSMKNYQAGLAKQQAGGQPVPSPTPAVEGLPEPPKENVVEMPKPPENELVQLIRGPAGPMILGALQRGESGDNFAASIEGLLGKLTYDKIAAVGKQGMIEAMQAVPEFWQAVTPDSISKFIDDFIAYGQEGPEDEE